MSGQPDEQGGGEVVRAAEHMTAVATSCRGCGVTAFFCESEMKARWGEDACCEVCDHSGFDQ